MTNKNKIGQQPMVTDLTHDFTKLDLNHSEFGDYSEVELPEFDAQGRKIHYENPDYVAEPAENFQQSINDMIAWLRSRKATQAIVPEGSLTKDSLVGVSKTGNNRQAATSEAEIDSELDASSSEVAHDILNQMFGKLK